MAADTTTVPGADQPDGTALLSVDDVAVNFTVRGGVLQAVRGVTLHVDDAETVAVVGESGCGKSTLARTICGLYTPARGTVRLRGVDVHRATKAEQRTIRRNLQLLFQEPLPSLNPRLTVKRILWEPMKANGMSRRLADAEDRIRDQLVAVGLDAGAAERYPGEFSGGQQQRIALARLLVLRPRLICADEPVSALDVSIQAQIVALMLDLQAEHGIAYVVISHDLPLVAQMATRVAVMYLGAIVEAGPAADVVTRPQHPYTAALRSATPEPRAAGTARRIVLPGEPPSPLQPPSGCPFHPRCPIARPHCAWDTPPLADIGQSRHVACFYPGELQP